MTAVTCTIPHAAAVRTAIERPVPVFICGVARSGTTFSGYLLNRHPHIRCTHEAVIFQDGMQIYEQCRDRHEPAGFRRLIERLAELDAGAKAHPWLAETLRAQVDELYARHQERPGFATVIEGAFTLARPGVTCFANKLIRTEFCPTLLREWPQAKIVLLIRDPRAAYASQRKFFGMRLKYAAIYWNLHVQYALAQRDNAERFLIVRFEDLMAAPAEQLGRILDFAGQGGPGVAEDIVAQVPPRREALHKWRQQLPPGDVRRLEAYCYDGMQAFGYAPEQATGPRRITAAGRLLETARQYARQIPLRPQVWRQKQLVRRLWQVVRGVTR